MLNTATVNALLDSIVLDRLSLHSAYSASGANELVGGSYARVAATFGAASGGARTLQAPVTFSVPAASTVAYVGAWTNAGSVFRGMFPVGALYATYQIEGSYNGPNQALYNRMLCHSVWDAVPMVPIVFLGSSPPDGIIEGQKLWAETSVWVEPENDIPHRMWIATSDPSGGVFVPGSYVNPTSQPTGSNKVSRRNEYALPNGGQFTLTAMGIGVA